MSVRAIPTIINPTQYTKTWKDDLYNTLNSYLYNTGKFKQLTDKGKFLGKIGKDHKCIYDELFFYKSLIQYLLLVKDEITKSSAIPFTVKDSYDLIAARNNAICRFNNTSIFDKLIELSGVANIALEGIDYMIFDPTILTTTSFPVGATVRSPNSLVYSTSDVTSLFLSGSTILISGAATPGNNGTFIVSSSFLQAFVGTVIVLTTSPLTNPGETLPISGYSYISSTNGLNDFIIQ